MRKYIIILLIFTSTTLFAQSHRVSAFMFQPEWYIGVHVGPNLVVAEGFPNYSIPNSIGISARGVLGYQLSPVIGFRAMGAVNAHRWENTVLNPPPTVAFGSQTLTGDLVLNMSNLFSTYSLNKMLELSLFGGVGAIHRNTKPFAASYMSYILRGGGQFDYRINQAVELNFIGELNVTGDNLNGFAVGTRFDIFPALMVGVTYHFRTTKPYGRGGCF